jgi:hypothetical protein
MSEILFNQTGDFEAYRAAERWAYNNGYSVGSMCSPQPTALIKGKDINVAKWKNLTPSERKAVDGIIESVDHFRLREGPVKITLYKKKP